MSHSIHGLVSCINNGLTATKDTNNEMSWYLQQIAGTNMNAVEKILIDGIQNLFIIRGQIY